MAKSSGKKSGKQVKETKDVKKVKVVNEVVEVSAEQEEESDNEDEGVDEVGMEKLLEALGKDGLNDFDQAQLETLAGDEEDEEDDSGTGENEESEEDEEVDEKSEEDDDEDDVVLDEIDDELHPDTVPRQKIQIDNKVALERIRDTIKLDPSLPWTETLVISYPESISVDVDDDLNRELAFYKQALHGATTARSLASKHKLPFTRPSDYFAEMVKSDSHMERIRQRLLDESATIKKSDDKRKEREGKKYGKQVQVEKIKEREKAKKDMEERLKGLKRKRKGAMDNVQADDEGFDIAVEDAISDKPSKRAKGSGAPKLPRTARDSKFGFGGGGKRSKQNTRASTDDFEPKGRGKFGPGKKSFGKGAKGGKPAQRPGKSRRMAARTSEKAKGKRRAVDVDDNSEQAEPSTLSRDLTIRFTEGIPDLTVKITAKDLVRDVKTKIRVVKPELEKRRLRLIHAGRLLADGTFIYSWLTSLEDKQKLAVKQHGDSAEETYAAMWLQCSVGPEIALEEEEDSEVQTSQIKPLRGFDRLASAGFSEADIESIRRQFHSQSSSDFLDRDFTSEEEFDEHARALEEQWIDSIDTAGTASLSQSSTPTSAATLLQGIVVGLFFPILPFFFFREVQPPVFWADGTEYETLGSVVFSRRMQMGLVVGFVVNIFFGLWIYLVAGS